MSELLNHIRRVPSVLVVLFGLALAGCGVFLLQSSRDTQNKDLLAENLRRVGYVKKVDSNTIPIRDLTVGTRVLARNPQISLATRAQWENLVSDSFKLFKLTLPLASGRSMYIEMIRPRHVEPFRSAKVGDQIRLNVPEMGAVGNALVTEILPCPKIKPGPGHVVISKFKHVTDSILEVQFEGSENPIGVTPIHPFWSVDKQEFVPIGALAIGDLVQTYSGDTKRIVSKLARPGPIEVFNLEVENEHVYFVGEQGILVHNDCPFDTIEEFLDSKVFTDQLYPDKASRDTLRKLFRETYGNDADRGKQIVYVLYDGATGEVYKVGKTSIGVAAKNVNERFGSQYSRKAYEYLNEKGIPADLKVDWAFVKPTKSNSVVNIEGQLRQYYRSNGHDLPWDNKILIDGVEKNRWDGDGLPWLNEYVFERWMRMKNGQ